MAEGAATAARHHSATLYSRMAPYVARVAGACGAAPGLTLPQHSQQLSCVTCQQVGLAQMLKGGVIMDVTTAEEARIAEEAGAVAVMALERVPADIRKDGGVARMSDASMIKAIKEAVTIPVMAKARIGHFVEAQILEALDVDYIDESEVGWLQLQYHDTEKLATPAAMAAMQISCCSATPNLTFCKQSSVTTDEQQWLWTIQAQQHVTAVASAAAYRSESSTDVDSTWRCESGI